MRGLQAIGERGQRQHDLDEQVACVTNAIDRRRWMGGRTSLTPADREFWLRVRHWALRAWTAELGLRCAHAQCTETKVTMAHVLWRCQSGASPSRSGGEVTWPSGYAR